MKIEKNAKAINPGDNNFVNIRAGIIQCDNLATVPFVIIPDYLLRTSLDKHLHLDLTLKSLFCKKY